jgi:hypothetical protein
MTAKIISGHTDVLETLQTEHETILEVFEVFKAAAGAAKLQPFAELKARLRQHMEAEEAEFYPLIDVLGVAEAALITTAESEHGTIETALAAIETAGADNASGGQVTTLETALKAHIASERAALFGVARNKLSMGQRRAVAAGVKDSHLASVLA